MTELSAIVLCYRAAGGITRVLEPLEELLQREGVDYELVLVANYWPSDDDPTPGIVERFAEGRARTVVVSRPKQGAMGWDLRSGLDAANGDVMIVIDGDSQNPVDDVLRLYRLMVETRADVGKGRRVTRHDGFYRRGLSVGYNALFRLTFGTGALWDINGKPKALTRGAYEAMSIRSDDWFADAEIVLEARRRRMDIVELPVVFNRNEERASFVRPGAIWEFVRHMVRYRLTGSP